MARRDWWSGRLRLGAGILTSLLALLAIFEAPTFLLWQVSVLVTEWGYLLALFALAPLLPGWRRTRSGQIGGALGLGAAVMALSPLVRALPVAQSLPARLAAIGPAPANLGRSAPIVAVDLLRGVALPQILPRTIEYGQAGGQRLELDLYPAQGGRGPAPLLLMVHGGSWSGGDKSELPSLNRYLAGRGYAVAAVNYRFAPQWPFPAARDDVRAALAYLKANAAALGIDARRIVLGGRSAGGQLALLVAYTADDPAIRGAISFYGPADMFYGYANPSNPLVLDSQQTLTDYLGGSPDSAAAAYTAASPLLAVGPHTPPTLLIHGGRDELVSPRQSERLDERLQQAGRPHMLLALPWATHGADFNFSGASGQLSTYAIEYFLGVVMS